MTYILLSVLCSVLVSVLLKLAVRFSLDIGQTVAWNYVMAGGLAIIVLQPPLTALHRPDVPWLALIGLGLLLPTIFLVLGASVQHAGIVRSDAAQRLSLLISLLAAFVLFGQRFDAIIGLGCVLGLIAMGALVWRTRPGAATPGIAGWGYPLTVFIGMGVIDVLFKRIATTSIPFGTALVVSFAMALVAAFAIELGRRMRFALRNVVGGAILGLLNFGNILFYLQAHRALPHNPALVFAGMNLGVVALGAFMGLVLFRERLGRVNAAGLAIALLAVGLLAHG